MTRIKDSRFSAEDTYHIEEIGEDRLVLIGGGNFYGYDLEDGEEIDYNPDSETRLEAERLAEKYGMLITDSSGDWWGYSEYTPEPGDVSIFEWEPKK